MLTVACVRVKANVPYPLHYVTRLQAMVARHLRRPHRFACLTDRPWELPPTIASVPIGSTAHLPGWWAKVELFNPAHALGDRVLYLDLDTLIVADLDPIVDYPSPFALVPHAGTFRGRDGLAVVPRFNSSVMVWDAGVPDHLFTDWRRAVAHRLWGDQDWIGEQHPQADTMPLEWFPRISELTNGHEFVVPSATKVILVKKPKNEEAAARWPAVREAWV